MRHCALCARIASGDAGRGGGKIREERMEQSNKVRASGRERERSDS